MVIKITFCNDKSNQAFVICYIVFIMFYCMEVNKTGHPYISIFLITSWADYIYIQAFDICKYKLIYELCNNTVYMLRHVALLEHTVCMQDVQYLHVLYITG